MTSRHQFSKDKLHVTKFELGQLTVMIFVFLGLVAGFGGLLAIIFHFPQTSLFSLILISFFSEDISQGKCSGGRGANQNLRAKQLHRRQGFVLIRRSHGLLSENMNFIFRGTVWTAEPYFAQTNLLDSILLRRRRRRGQNSCVASDKALS